VLRAGGRRYAIETDLLAHGFDEASVISCIPTPLPSAPPAVLGVVRVRGRIYTALDIAAALGGEHNLMPREETTIYDVAALRIVPLRGKEQLALALESVEGTLDGSYESLTAPDAPAEGLRGVIYDGEGRPILVLEPGKLFAAATRDMERRRRRRS